MHTVNKLTCNRALQVGRLAYLYLGSLAVLVWKCGTQLLREVSYSTLEQELARREEVGRRAVVNYNKKVV